MNLVPILELIERQLKVAGLKEEEASRQAGAPDAIRNIRRAIAKGKGGPTAKTLSKLAPVLRLTSAELLGAGDGPEKRPPHPTGGGDAVDRLKYRRNVLQQEIDALRRQLEHLDFSISVLEQDEPGSAARSRKR